ncbi:cysteine desulfurase family protein [Cohnella sp. JJ-181]|uniref:cysteine desulfurase family protein n=1 Tax=Cohnella rhizoplanae TaxID=2974897 RepID=UPI0022FFB2D5|nr:cysteine desulfurase family protein [Cohnella sp. JJ-181]CAI6019561.1 Cysteine desulfurase IscS [Cohnella sp. JJ-181]
MKTYYFDHSASTPPYESVIRTVAELMAEHYAHPSALHRAGTDAGKLVERARAAVAGLLGAAPGEVVFTSGGTESNNLAIKGILGLAGRKTRHMITTAIEHSSVHGTARQLESEGVRVTYLTPDEQGRVAPSDVAAAIADDTALVSVMHANNETGALQPIEEIGALLRDRPRVRFHVDGVQAVGKIPFDWARSGVDLYSASAHKFRGPRGAGYLLVRDGLKLHPLLAGGGQESDTRSGTHNLPGIVGMAQALRLAIESMPERRKRMYELRRRLLSHVERIPELVLNSPSDERLASPQIVNLSYPGMRPEVLLHMLEEHGVLVSTQSACSSKSLKPSRVLTAMGLGEARATGSIRVSFGDEHVAEDIDILAERLQSTVAKLKPLERN